MEVEQSNQSGKFLEFDESGFVLNHFKVEDDEVETYACIHCGKRYGMCQTCRNYELQSSGEMSVTHLTNCKALSRYDLMYEELKPMIWSIQVKDHEGVISGTGFSVSDNGLIMTVAHIFESTKIRQIEVHTLDKKFRGTANLALIREEADLALLEVSNIDRCASLVFLSDAWVTAGEVLVTAGVATCLIGYASSGCTEIKEIQRGHKCKTRTYYPEQHPARKYRVIGDLFNAEEFKLFNADKFTKSLNPYVPIIQGQLNTIGGNSGSPVFNIKGEVLGIVHGHVGTDSISIHVSELVDFLDEYIDLHADPPIKYATKDIQNMK